jgi:NAD(P)-dependent dehydrogenase (short-subunit alcohol dehydrogenase family)
MRDFRDRVAVITGGASGIGRATADKFAAEGLKLVLADIEEGPLKEAVAQLSDAGAQVIGVPTDVSVLADIERVRDQALSEFGAVHVVFNNAGVGGGGDIASPIEMWQWAIGVNLWGVVNGCVTFLPLLREQNFGHIVNTGSLAGLGGVPGLGIYCTTKFAVVGLSESLHYDLAGARSDVKVSVLCPGFVRTRIAESHRNMPDNLRASGAFDMPGEMLDVMKAVVAAGIEPSQVADAIFGALQDERFFILPHEKVALATTRGRLAWMEGGHPPGTDLNQATRP